MPRRAALLAITLWIGSPSVAIGTEAGEIVARRGEASVREMPAQRWVPARVGQTLAVGDTARTGTHGMLAIVMTDRTVLRIHPDSEATIEGVRDLNAAAPTLIALARGALWARAQALARATTALVQTITPARAVEIRTATATLGIRGTDWYVKTDQLRTELIVLSGSGELYNALGSVTVGSGELGVAEAGRAPVKRVLVDVRDRPLLQLEFRPAWFELLRLTPASRYAELLAERARLEALPSASLRDTLALRWNRASTNSIAPRPIS